MTKSRVRVFTLNTAFVLLSIFIAFLLCEIGIRLYSGLAFPKMTALDEKLGWRHAPNVSRTFVNEFGEEALVIQNAYGHRGKSYDAQKGAGVFRILALGDSFTEGVQVGEDDLFTARMDAADDRLQVINTGVGGWGTVQEYLYLTSEGLKFSPDLVLLMVFQNDLSDNTLSYSPGIAPRPYAKLRNGELLLVETLDSSAYGRFLLPVPFRTVLDTHSYFFLFLNSRIYQPLFAARMRQLQQEDMRKIDTAASYEIFYGVLNKLNEVLNQQKIALLVVLIPSREDVATGHFDTGTVVGEFCREKNFNCLSLLERLRQETSRGVKPYFPTDMHWTKDGHRIAADEVLQYLQSNPHIYPPSN